MVLNVIAEPLYRERIIAALPVDHPFAKEESVDWSALRGEIILVQDWADSHATREFYASLLGVGARFSAHGASKQSIIGLVGAGFGITLATESQAQVAFPGVVFKPIKEPNAFVEVLMTWAADAFYEPWTAARRYRRVEHEMIEEPCAENNQHFEWHIPVADKPDF
jgi:DNA-binding transcriptional LysR family regulator